MPVRSCMDCREYVRLEDWLEHKKRHRYQKSKDGGWSSYRNRAEQKRFRKAVLARDGHACTFVLATGVRCGVTDDLIAHHLTPLAKGGGFDLANGTTLCRAHHRWVDSYAR